MIVNIINRSRYRKSIIIDIGTSFLSPDSNDGYFNYTFILKCIAAPHINITITSRATTSTATTTTITSTSTITTTSFVSAPSGTYCNSVKQKNV